MRHGYTTMEEIRDNMEHQLDAYTVMEVGSYGDYGVSIANEIINLAKEFPNAYCKETALWMFGYACRWDRRYTTPALNKLIDAWLNTEEEE